jgi:transcriptional regulator with XRE-family HTH domain
MRSKIFQQILDETPEDVEIFVKLYADLVVRINQLLREKNISKKELAEKMDKKPSEISKWLSGDHNFTLRSLAKLSAELGEPLLEVPKKKTQTEFIENGFTCRVHTFVSYKKIEPKSNDKVWLVAEEPATDNELSYAG